MNRRIGAAAARRIAVAASHLAAPRPRSVGPTALRRAIDRLGVLQIDTVNVFERSHFLPLFSRLGPYDRGVLDALVHHTACGAPRLGAYTEYLAHAAAIMPVADWPLWAWHRSRLGPSSQRRWAAAHRGLIAEVRAEFAERGPLRVGQLEHEQNRPTGGGWWNKNDVHWAARHLADHGELITLGRDRFRPVLALTEQVLPSSARAEVPRVEALRELVRRASVALGVATLGDLADYYRLPAADTRGAVADLAADGLMEQVAVEGWDGPAWLATGARVPRRVTAAALLSPFDPLVWYRPRAERIFGFHYRISIYSPSAARQHGYYVLPVLVDDAIVGRVDLKSDRRAGVLRVQHAHVESSAAGSGAALARRVAPLLTEAASWQGLGAVSVTGEGTWASELSAAL